MTLTSRRREIPRVAVAAVAIACERRVMRMVVVVVLVAALGCSKSKHVPPPAPKSEPVPVVVTAPEATPEPAPSSPRISDAEFEATMVKTLAMFNALGDAVSPAADDCGDIADRLTKVLDDHSDFIASTKRYKDDEAFTAKSDAWIRAHIEEIRGALMAVDAAEHRCASNAKYQVFQRRFFAT